MSRNTDSDGKNGIRIAGGGTGQRQLAMRKEEEDEKCQGRQPQDGLTCRSNR